jgi:hypothetical protein
MENSTLLSHGKTCMGGSKKRQYKYQKQNHAPTNNEEKDKKNDIFIYHPTHL